MPIEVPSVRILIVDDDKAICDFMQSLLEKDGFVVKTMGDPTLVEDEVRKKYPDAIGHRGELLVPRLPKD